MSIRPCAVDLLFIVTHTHQKTFCHINSDYKKFSEKNVHNKVGLLLKPGLGP